MNPNLFSKGLKYNYAHVVLPRLVWANPRSYYERLSSPQCDLLMRTLWQDVGKAIGVTESPEGLSVSRSALRDDVTG